MTWQGWEQFNPDQLKPAKRSKYRAQPTQVAGIRFDSKREADRYQVLLDDQARGRIRNLELQPRYPISVMNARAGVMVTVAEYIADFRYTLNGVTVCEDAKSSATRTPLYQLKKKLVEAIYGIQIFET